MYLTNVAPYTVRCPSKRSTHDPSPLGVLTPVPLSGRSSPPCPPLRSGHRAPLPSPPPPRPRRSAAEHPPARRTRVEDHGYPPATAALSRRERGSGGEDRTVRRTGVEDHGYPPAIAPITRNGSAPDATASGRGASGGSWVRSRSHAKNRRNGRRCAVTWSRMVPRNMG